MWALSRSSYALLRAHQPSRSALLLAKVHRGTCVVANESRFNRSGSKKKKISAPEVRRASPATSVLHV